MILLGLADKAGSNAALYDVAALHCNAVVGGERTSGAMADKRRLTVFTAARFVPSLQCNEATAKTFFKLINAIVYTCRNAGMVYLLQKRETIKIVLALFKWRAIPDIKNRTNIELIKYKSY